MKRCPECRRDYFDDTLSFCLDDGARLVEGPARRDDVNGAPTVDLPSEAATRAYAAEDKTHSTAAWNRNSLVAGIIGVVLITALSVGSYWYYYNDDEVRQIDSIAVMPFENVGDNPDAEYLSEGLTDSLVYRLSQVGNLKVSPASSVIRYKGKEIDPVKVGRELGVSSVLVGRITQRGDSIVVSANLVDVRNDKSLWGELYDRKLADLLSTQREIAREIAEALKIQVSREQGITKTYTNSNEAYLLQLQGRFS